MSIFQYVWICVHEKLSISLIFPSLLVRCICDFWFLRKPGTSGDGFYHSPLPRKRSGGRVLLIQSQTFIVHKCNN